MERFSTKNLCSFVALGATVLSLLPAHAQELQKEVQTDKYMRNSVCLMMLEDASVPQKEILEDAFLNAAWNEKYNNHNISERIIDPAQLTITAQDEADFNMACTPIEQYLELKRNGGAAPKQPYYNEMMTQIIRSLVSSMSETVDTVIQLNVARTANKYLLENRVAKQLADMWLMDASGNYTDSVLVERGMLNVSADERDVASASAAAQQKLLREIDMAELLGNTFVVATRFSYKPKEGVVADRMMPLYAAAELDPSGYGKMGLKIAQMGVNASLGKGYYVTVDSYLFRLRWNEEIEGEFYNLWDNTTGEFNREVYDKGDLFSLQFIGNERAWAKTKAGIFADKSEEELIRLAAVDAVDAVLAKFEKKYDQFKTKTPLIVREGIDKKGKPVRTYAVRLGTRDGLEGGEVFEVLEKQTKQTKFGDRTVYDKKGELIVDKKNVWNNSYSDLAGADETESAEEMTLLTGKDKGVYYEGMLLRMKTAKGKK